MHIPLPNSRKIFGFLRFVAYRFEDDRCAQVASSLTFTTLLSLIPLITVMVTVFAAFPVFSDLMTQIKIFMLMNMVPEVAGKVITVYMTEFSSKAAKLTMLGIASLTITALLLMYTIDHAFNAIWRVRKPRTVSQRFLTYWTVLTIGPIILGASLSVTYYLVSFSLGYVKHIPLMGPTALKLVPVALMSLAFTLLYAAVPNRYVPWKHALVGGIFAGIAFELMKRGFAWYITSFPTYTLIYGAFATFPIFLLWIYFSWLVILLGAVIAAALSHWRGGTWQIIRAPGWQFEAALRLLQALAEAQRAGHSIKLAWLSQHVDLGLDEMEALLDRLAQANFVRRADKDAWLLLRAPQEISTADVFRLFVFDAKSKSAADDAYQTLLGKLGEQYQATLTPTLADLLPAPAPLAKEE
ncbi:MAG: YihY family inner membrane protein [Pseudomonadota bacterium]